jgi:hypothetical protein
MVLATMLAWVPNTDVSDEDQRLRERLLHISAFGKWASVLILVSDEKFPWALEALLIEPVGAERGRILRGTGSRIAASDWQRVLRVLRNVPAEAQRAEIIDQIHELMPKELRPALVEIARQLRDDNARAVACGALAEDLSQEDVASAVAAARRATDPMSGAIGLAALARHLPESGRPARWQRRSQDSRAQGPRTPC